MTEQYDERNETMNVTTMKVTTTHRPLLIAAVVVVALGLGLWFWGASAPIVHDAISQPLGTAARAEVEIALRVGQLRIGALSQSSNLVAGDIAYRDQSSVVRDFAVRGDTATFKLREQDSQSNSLIKHSDDAILWDLRLNPATPMRLTIATDVGNGTIDLGQLQVTDLDLTTSVGSTTLTLPRQGQVQANVRSGVGNLTIRIPEGVAVRIESSAGLGAVSVSGDYRRQGDVYVSPDFETAANRIDLHATSGIGGITIQPMSE
jgi:hypothetical protein